MKTLTRNKPLLFRLRACLAAPLRWLKFDGRDGVSGMMRRELLLFIVAMAIFNGILLIHTYVAQPQEPLVATLRQFLSEFIEDDESSGELRYRRPGEETS